MTPNRRGVSPRDTFSIVPCYETICEPVKYCDYQHDISMLFLCLYRHQLSKGSDWDGTQWYGVLSPISAVLLFSEILT